jgi:hypothetical protein
VARQPDWKKRGAQNTDRQNLVVQVAPPEGAASKTVTHVGNGKAVVEETKMEGKKKKHAEKFTRDTLEGMKMKNLRVIGDKLGVRDNKKDELIDKIMEASG